MESKGLGSNPNSAIECIPLDMLIITTNPKYCKAEETEFTLTKYMVGSQVLVNEIDSDAILLVTIPTQSFLSPQ